MTAHRGRVRLATVQELTATGLGLEYGTVALVEARKAWGGIARTLADAVRKTLGDRVVGVEHVGSTAIPGLLAKPIVDLAAGTPDVPDPDVLTAPLRSAGWEYRGDAGDDGGLVFVLETRPWFRVAHLHVVRHGATQWRNYLRFRERLRSDADARARYTSVKRALLAAHPRDRKAYQAGKEGTVASILGDEVARG